MVASNLRKICLFFSSAVIMMVGTRIVSTHMPPTLLTNLFQVSMGFLIYFSLTAVSKVNPVIDYFFKKVK
ncbi:hypothetical protein [Enterococcus durans]|uniref:hypothetical protein n=1 Tax=Enterococcus durans TaxID=53345 RepID=UPI0012439BE3|nr:hypothetical protein [Enterococcus durans]MCB8506741.1 hypothetical protein [Enterococcus durans]MCB8516782.1 hypothetical protein [Enterococcus durans]